MANPGTGIATTFGSGVSLYYQLQQTTANSVNAVNIASVGAISANTLDNISFMPEQSGALWVSVAVNTTSLRLYNSTGSNILSSSVNSTTLGVLANVTAGTEYILQVVNTANILAATVAATLQYKTSPTVSTYFPDGFVDQIAASSPNVTVVVDQYGSLLYQFTNYPITTLTPFNIAYASDAIASLSGSGEGVVVVFSDNTFETNQLYPFNVGQSVPIIFRPLRTGTYNGTVAVSTSNAGISAFVNFLPILQ